jgi:putative ABC transport system ATP-binding protein
VAIARGLANKPTVVLADEPTGNLDSVNAKQIIELLLKLHRDLGVTLVLVTHDLAIADLATRTIRMKDGRVISDSGVTPPTDSP